MRAPFLELLSFNESGKHVYMKWLPLLLLLWLLMESVLGSVERPCPSQFALSLSLSLSLSLVFSLAADAVSTPVPIR